MKNDATELFYMKTQTPIGPLFLVADDHYLHALLFDNTWADYKKSRKSLTESSTPLLKRAANQLKDYFNGERRAFDLPYRFAGTEFQNQVWTALTKIPYGKTISYGEQAAKIGRPKAMRAVGGTNGLNPLSIIVPCHRVIGKSGRLTGYAGGIERKEFLLKLEGILT